MKTLLLLRHAKSSKDNPALEDFARPLNKRGKDDAQIIGKYLSKKKLRPDLVISSPANRARRTTGLVLKSAGLKIDPRFDERIYEASARRLLKVLSEIEENANMVMLVGHNPGFEQLFEALTGDRTRLPTASLAGLELAVDKWKQVRPEIGKLKWLISPKDSSREQSLRGS
jgi:phosphohistidine phosphatase